MHFGPSSGEPCPFRLEPINPATLGKTASWVWKRGCQQSRGRLCTGERGPLPCETGETGLKSHRGRQQSTAPRAFPGANGGRDGEQPELSLPPAGCSCALAWGGAEKGIRWGGERRFVGMGRRLFPRGGARGRGCLRRSACSQCSAPSPRLSPHPAMLFQRGMGTALHCHSSCSSQSHSQGNICPPSSRTSRDWAHGSANPGRLFSTGGPGHHGWGSGGRKSPAVGRRHPPAQPTLGDWDGPR